MEPMFSDDALRRPQRKDSRIFGSAWEELPPFAALAAPVI
jgi:hypothetical protein